MTTIVRKIHFSAGHRLWHHEGQCATIHGHNYEVHFFATAEKLDDVGRVIDFGVLKDRLGGWIDEHWDHAFICYDKDTVIREALKVIPEQRIFLLEMNPTAENLARYLLEVVGPAQLAGTGVRLIRVVLWETPNCRAEASID